MPVEPQRKLPDGFQGAVDAIGRLSAGLPEVNTGLGIMYWAKPEEFAGKSAAEAEAILKGKLSSIGISLPDEISLNYWFAPQGLEIRAKLKEYALELDKSTKRIQR